MQHLNKKNDKKRKVTKQLLSLGIDEKIFSHESPALPFI
jgi:hypothetical protein